jgi:alanine-alpha-ketoisovalerate/valine-pyruvate aminotransferase
MQDELIHGREYHLWYKGKYLGIATWQYYAKAEGNFIIPGNCNTKFIGIADEWQMASEILTTK